MVGAHLKILGDGQAWEHVLSLRDETHTLLDERVRGQVGDDLAVQTHGTIANRDQTEHCLKKRRLTRAVRADDAYQFA